MVKRAIDSRIPALIRNGVQEKKRSFFVVVGDRQKDVIVNLYHVLLNVDVKLNKSVLWAYKNKLLGFTSHRQKREKKIRKEIKRGIRDVDTEDPFELFVSTQNIRYVYYKETDKILGNTYGMCILQDFEAITPNLLARTIETVEGGGLVLLLLKGMTSLKQLYTLSMDIHSRYRTEAYGDVTARFNERFLLSLGSCDSCLVVDDELNVLPISGGKSVQQLPPVESEKDGQTPEAKELASIKEGLADTQPVGSLITLARTVDQAKALLTFVDAIAEKTLQSTVALTAARGRGKSAALGVAIAAAIAYGYSNIFITSPSPENLKTLFEFVFKGFDALDYMDHVDYTIIQSTNIEFNKAVVRVNVHRQHRQTIQYIQPQDAYTLGQAELLVIDEAAAIPLPLVRKLMGPYLTFMASTINGYEGTGRSLSLKLIQQLRDQSRTNAYSSNSSETVTDRNSGHPIANGNSAALSSRSLREITLSTPIRYALHDDVEKWLNRLLCLDVPLSRSSNLKTLGCPHPSQCQLLHVNRDTLFSFHPVSEKFLQNMLALYVASHYKNSPNDLQLMSDAPAHQLFVLVPPVNEGTNRLPEPLCVVQVALEGKISKESVLNSLSRGQRAGGDLIPWLVSQQFQDENFAGLSGARIVRIATNPEYISMGYGSRALELLLDFYSNKFTSLSESENTLPLEQEEKTMVRVSDEELENVELAKEEVKVRDINAMPPLFTRLAERKPPTLDYVGVSYGLTPQLHKFWKRKGFIPIYLRQTANELTGEHTCVMLRALDHDNLDTVLDEKQRDSIWLADFARDFQARFLSLLSYGSFRSFSSVTALAIDEATILGTQQGDLNSRLQKSHARLSKDELDTNFSPFDLKRLDAYASNMLDWHVILDLVPKIAQLYFTGRIKALHSVEDGDQNGVKLTGVQQALLLAIGLQRKTLEDVEKELGLQTSQLLAMFVKVIRKVSQCFRAIISNELARDLPRVNEGVIDYKNNNAEHHDQAIGLEKGAREKMSFVPLTQPLNEELQEGVTEIDRVEKERARELINALPLDRYAIAEEDTGWEGAEDQVKGGKTSGVVTIKSRKSREERKRKAGEATDEALKEAEKGRERRGKKGRR
ncbi:DUF699-domain-containing protein [Viridothelium virens]|uniref:RNA cytidine acetyltransferase n=1 Tax=Viridothelium virens TaxID=1048519 RepID=A0A6A6HA71_VIRVR|nr:DUF699-domain-containing protein [Viridothelium virens]